MPKSGGGPVNNAPGWFYDYSPGHGYAAKHAYNPLNGEAMSWRQAAAVRDGKQTVNDVLLKQQTPIAEFDVARQKSEWKVTAFRHMSGAYHYATEETSNPSYFVVRGRINPTGGGSPPYEGEASVSYRAISTLTAPDAISNKLTLEEAWERAQDDIEIGQQVVQYLVWERIE